ncbi:MAG TPA: hypothetical protein VIY72_05355 [Acidimicrobiales bacterium]
MSTRRRLALGAIALVGIEALLVHQGRTYGSTPTERRDPFPGDDLVTAPDVVTTHAITIDAPPASVWPWLIQMGWGRAGWYTARWVDLLLFPANGPSADRILTEWQGLAEGDHVPDGPPETDCGFVVAQLQKGRALVLRSDSHLPKHWREQEWARLDWSWAFVLRPLDGATRTRFLFRSRWTTRPWWLTLGAHLLVVPADLVMSRSMLRGVRARAEALHKRQAGRVSD